MKKYEHLVLRPHSSVSKAMKYDDMRTLVTDAESKNRDLHGKMKELVAQIKFKDSELLRLQNKNAELVHKLTSRPQPILAHMQKELEAIEAQAETDKKKLLCDIKQLNCVIRERQEHYNHIASELLELTKENIKLKQTITELETLKKADEEVIQSFHHRNDELMETVKVLSLTNADLREHEKDLGDEYTKLWNHAEKLRHHTQLQHDTQRDFDKKFKEAKTEWVDWHVREMREARIQNVKFVLGDDYPKVTCPVTLDVLTRANEPVVASDGHTYCVEALKNVIRTTCISPLTRDTILPTYKPNFALLNLMDAIEDYMTRAATEKDRKQAEAFVEASLSFESPHSES